MDNNFAELTGGQISYSSQLSAFPFTNSINKFRSRVWKPSGFFEITTGVNDKIYINDGSNKTATLSGTFTTPALFAAHVQTQLNAVSSAWTVSYDSAGETYLFTIAHTGSATLRLSVATQAAWDILGFTTTSDLVGTSFVADQQRNHTSERVTFDLGYNAEITFFSVIGPLDEIFSVSDSATVRLMGNNLNEWDAPPLTINLTPTDAGIFHFLQEEDTGYRFWRLEVIDRQNPAGPEGLSFGYIYLGDFTTLSQRNVRSGFEVVVNDPSETLVSESGALHFDRKTKYTKISSVSIDFMNRTDKDALASLFKRFGTTTPFFVSLDPTLSITSSFDELTKYVVFDGEPKFSHIKNDVFSLSLNFREVL